MGSPPVRAVDQLDLDVADGEFLVLVGPSGSGKSTALRMLAGLEDVDEGTIQIGSKDVTNVPPKGRDIAMVFQNYALYPHMSVYENMAFALKLRKTSKSEIERRVKEAAGLLQLEEYLNRKPKALSGGQRQRIAIARAFLADPRILVLDDATSSVDASTEQEIKLALREVMAGRTTFVIAHRLSTISLADEIAVLDDGRLVAHGTHDELLDESPLYREIVEKGLPDQVFLNRNPVEREVAGL